MQEVNPEGGLEPWGESSAVEALLPVSSEGDEEAEKVHIPLWDMK